MEMSKKEKELLFKTMMKEKQKHYLDTMDTSLALIGTVLENDLPNDEKLRLVQTYRKHFDEKLKHIKEEIVRLTNKDEELLEDYKR